VGISDYNLLLMGIIDKQYTETPYYGIRRMTKELNNKGYKVNRKRVRRLMRLMGLEAIYPRRNLSKNTGEHRIYPYLLKGVSITRANQVWSADITYIRMARGFVYLVAIIDWWSRYVLSWRISTTLEPDFCVGGGFERCAKDSDARYFQYRPGQPVYRQGFYQYSVGKKYPSQYGRAGSGI
jgi:putative transposase